MTIGKDTNPALHRQAYKPTFRRLVLWRFEPMLYLITIGVARCSISTVLWWIHRTRVSRQCEQDSDVAHSRVLRPPTRHSRAILDSGGLVEAYWRANTSTVPSSSITDRHEEGICKQYTIRVQLVAHTSAPSNSEKTKSLAQLALA